MQAELTKARWAALLSASTSGDEATVRQVLNEDPSSTRVQDSVGWTPLMRAAAGGHKQICNLLLTAELPASTKAMNKFGKTALHYACASGHELIARVLIMYGAEPTAKDKDGRTAFDDALSNGHRQLVQALSDKTPGMSLPPQCEPPVLFRADTTSMTICWEAVEVDTGRAFKGQPASPEAAALLHVTAYRVQLATAAAGDEGGNTGIRWTTVSSDIPVGGCTFKVRGLSPGSSYLTRVSARNAYGWSQWSDPSDVMITAKATGPQSPAPAAAASSGNGNNPSGSPIMFWGRPPAAPASAGAAATPSRGTATPTRQADLTADSRGRQSDDGRGGRSPVRGLASDAASSNSARGGDGVRMSSPSPSRGAGKGLEEMRAILRTLQIDLEEEGTKRRAAEEELARYTASGPALARLSMEGLTTLEASLEASLRAVRTAKEAKMKEALGDELSRTLCSVCLTRPKNMLFLPCKHLCACGECAARIMKPERPADPAEAAKQSKREPMCPICRVPVREVLDVYA